MLTRMSPLLEVLSRSNDETADRARGVVVEAESDRNQCLPPGLSMSEEESSLDDETPSGKLQFSLGGGFLCLKIRFAGNSQISKLSVFS